MTGLIYSDLISKNKLFNFLDMPIRGADFYDLTEDPVNNIGTVFC